MAFVGVICSAGLSGTGLAQFNRGSQVDDWVRMSEPPPAISKLHQRCRIVTSRTDLRELAAELQRQCAVPILVDRRLDPALPSASPGTPSTRSLGPTLQAACDQLAEWAECDWATDGTWILFAPRGQAAAVMTQVLKLRQQWTAVGLSDSNATSSSNAASKREMAGRRGGGGDWLRPREVSWSELTTPNELVRELADAWQVKLPEGRLPHDLWGEKTLGDLDLPAALGAATAGFGLMPSWNAYRQACEFEPLELDGQVEIGYPVGAFRRAREVVSEMRRRGRTLQLRRRGDWSVVEADASVHTALQMAIWKPVSSGQPPGDSGTPPSEKTFRVKNKPLRLALQTLAAADGRELVEDPAVKAELDALITAEVTATTIESLIRALAEQAGLSVESDATAIRIGR